jgi:hypothetical protein
MYTSVRDLNTDVTLDMTEREVDETCLAPLTQLRYQKGTATFLHQDRRIA